MCSWSMLTYFEQWSIDAQVPHRRITHQHGGQKYIGETKKALEMRLKEHQAATRRGETEKSAITEHA